MLGGNGRRATNAKASRMVTDTMATAKSSTEELAAAGVGQFEIDSFKPAALKKVLHASEQRLARLVDIHSHDSHEETDEELEKFMNRCTDVVGKALNVVLRSGVAIDQAHELLQVVADSWDNILCIPFQREPTATLFGSAYTASAEYELIINCFGRWVCPRESHRALLDVSRNCSSHYSVSSSATRPYRREDFLLLKTIYPPALVGAAWPLLLARAADQGAGVSDAALLQMIKDAFDRDVVAPEEPSELEKKGVRRMPYPNQWLDGELGVSIARGRVRLSRLVKSRKWIELPSAKQNRTNAMRRCIIHRNQHIQGPKTLHNVNFLFRDED